MGEISHSLHPQCKVVFCFRVRRAVCVCDSAKSAAVMSVVVASGWRSSDVHRASEGLQHGFASGTDLAGRFMVRTAQSDIASSALRTVTAQRLALHPAFKCAHKQLGCVMLLLQVCGSATASASALRSARCRHVSLLRSRLKYSSLPISQSNMQIHCNMRCVRLAGQDHAAARPRRQAGPQEADA